PVAGRKGAKTLARLAGQMPGGALRPHPLLRRTARSGQAARQALSRTVLRPARPTRAAEEGQLHRGILFPAIAVLAVDNARLVPMELHPPLPQAGREPLRHPLRLPLRSALHSSVIRLAGKRARRPLPAPPAV